MKAKNASCSFCGRKKDETLMLISGLEAHICEQCADQAHKIVEQELGFGKAETEKNEADTVAFTLPRPDEIKKYLDQYVIGQDEAKKVLSVSVYNHYKRVLHPQEANEVELEKSNILMVGETGTGKTLLARSLAKYLNVPFCIADATVLTEAGYVGDDVESILSRLLQVANYDSAAAEKGIIYLDEIDKISRKGDNPSITRDVSGEGVQQGLLKILEGTVANVAPEGGRKHPEQKYVKIDTRNILFICGGAFDGIEKIISRRIQSRAVGFNNGEQTEVAKQDVLRHISPADLKKFGLIPEIIGRLPIITSLEPLDKEALRRILTEPKNALIKQYEKLFAMENISLQIDTEVIDFIVEQAHDNQLGARGLRGICEAILLDYMYDAPVKKGNNKKLKITLQDALDKWERNKKIFKAA
jgi:ATP-dependent Clp protease ATP-binding subunit ClpX